MYEVAVASLTEKFSISRKKAVLGITAGVSFAAVIVSLGFGVLDFVQLNGMNILDMLDFLGNSILLPVCSLFACFAAGWILKPKAVIDEICSCGAKFRGQQVFSFALRYLVPAAILIILITGIF
jgi:NSS family neurotransmitter:Na+ symporter